MAEDNKQIKKVIPETKVFTLVRSLKLGSNTKGATKKAYKVGEKVSLTPEQETLYRKQNLI